MNSQQNPPGALAPTTGVESLPDDRDDPSELTFYDNAADPMTERWITVGVDHVVGIGGDEW